MSRSKITVVACGALIWNSAAVFTLAQAPGSAGGGSVANLEGLTVAGKGSIGAKPNRLEIDLEISATSEMTSDVIVKYRDAKKRIQEAFATLKLSNVSVDEKALAVDQKGQAFNPYMMDTPPARRGKVEVQLTRKLVVRCNEIREMDEEALLQLVAKLLDVAQDAGAKVGSQGNAAASWYYGNGNTDNGLVRFILDDFETFEDKAYTAAVADARTRAGRLAKLNGVELGPVAGVREVLVPGEKVQSQSFSFYRSSSAPDDAVPKKQLESSKFQEIPVKVELQVRFTTIAAKTTGKEAGK